MGDPVSNHEINSIREFYNRWPSLREHPLTLLERADLSPDQRQILGWMILVIDRVGPADIQRQPDPAQGAQEAKL